MNYRKGAKHDAGPVGIKASLRPRMNDGQLSALIQAQY
jgi:hypothetical protein